MERRRKSCYSFAAMSRATRRAGWASLLLILLTLGLAAQLLATAAMASPSGDAMADCDVCPGGKMPGGHAAVIADCAVLFCGAPALPPSGSLPVGAAVAPETALLPSRQDAGSGISVAPPLRPPRSSLRT